MASRQPNQLGLEMGLQANQVHFTYDALGRITREQTGDDIVEFAYDELNNLSRLTLPQGDTVLDMRLPSITLLRVHRT
ncbi:RHS repeat domain-containing protein [Providencia rettgeri]|uniref:RHS repeat domain-containing protein n=1 Tax=Providencia rettgeri TaxID=587 RepID=UPI0032DB6FC1